MWAEMMCSATETMRQWRVSDLPKLKLVDSFISILKSSLFGLFKNHPLDRSKIQT